MTEAASAPHEVELKLRVQPGALDRVRDWPGLRDHLVGSWRAVPLTAEYHDTPDYRLRARGLALRLRREAGRLVQTLKALPQDGDPPFARLEWQVAVDGDRPDLAAFADPAIPERTGLVLPGELGPMFQTRIERHQAVLRWPDEAGVNATVELALDSGTIEAAGRTMPVAEVELELIEGSPAALVGLAQALRPLLPLAVEGQDKAQRGYALATGVVAPPRRAAPIRLDPTATVEAGMQAVLRQGWRHWLAAEAPARAGLPAGVHQLRVALRRLRSTLRLFAPVVDEAAFRRLDGRLQAVLLALAPARDLDVFIGETLPALDSEAGADAALSLLRQAAETQRQRAQERLVAVLDSQAYADSLLDLLAWVELAGWHDTKDVDRLIAQRQELAAFAEAALARCRRRLLRRGQGFDKLDAAGRHRVRIALKRLRYGVDAFTGLYPAKAVRPFAKRLAQLQDELGHANDGAVARQLAAELAAASPSAAMAAGIVMGWHSARLAGGGKQLAARWEDFVTTPPFWAGRQA